MATKLYVGNLWFQTTSEDLRNYFERAGNVESASVVEDRDTGRSRGYGFVKMSTPEEAARAIELLNGLQIRGRYIVHGSVYARGDDERSMTVREANPLKDPPGGTD